MGKQRQLECRVVVTRHPNRHVFDLGMYDPLNMRYEPLGTHPARDEERVVRGLADRIEREGHRLTWCELTAG